MLFFLDTEFTSFERPYLISIALVSEDGQYEIYLESTDFPNEACSPFVETEVLPLLDAPDGDRLTAAELRVRLWAWFETLPRSVRIACDDARDQLLLHRALGSDELPANLAPALYDLRLLTASPAFERAVDRYHRKPGRPWHHALHDARGLRRGWLNWLAKKK